MDTVDPLRFIVAFIFVLGLIGLLAMVLRRYGTTLQAGISPLLMRKMVGAKDEAGRMGIVEVRYLDPRRKLVLVRRDNVEHLLLLADGHSLVVETVEKNNA